MSNQLVIAPSLLAHPFIKSEIEGANLRLAYASAPGVGHAVTVVPLNLDDLMFIGSVNALLSTRDPLITVFPNGTAVTGFDNGRWMLRIWPDGEPGFAGRVDTRFDLLCAGRLVYEGIGPSSSANGWSSPTETIRSLCSFLAADAEHMRCNIDCDGSGCDTAFSYKDNSEFQQFVLAFDDKLSMLSIRPEEL